MTIPARPLALVTRRDELTGEPRTESRHVGHVVVTLDDRVVAAHGDVERPTFLRSAIKPIQARVCLEILAEAGWPGGRPEPAEIAIGWASHQAEDEQLATIRRLLERSGTSPDALTCPPDVRPGGPADKARIHHNCSGKHALFALAGQALGLTGAHLIDRDGELQVRILAALTDAVGPVSAVGVDGCGAPAVEAPLVGLARAFGSVAGDHAYAQVRQAGFDQPGMVAGGGRLGTALLSNGTLAKNGAEGVFAAGWVGAAGRVGVAVKTEDGADRAASAAIAAVVEAAGRPLGGWVPEPALGGGRPVGEVAAAPELDEVLDEVRELG